MQIFKSFYKISQDFAGFHKNFAILAKEPVIKLIKVVKLIKVIKLIKVTIRSTDGEAMEKKSCLKFYIYLLLYIIYDFKKMQNN